MISQTYRSPTSLSADLKKEFTNFLQTFYDPYDDSNRKDYKYMKLIQQMLESDRKLLLICPQDLISFNSDLANMIFEEYYKYENDLNMALTSLAR